MARWQSQERVIKSERLRKGVVEVALAMLAAITGAAVAPRPVLKIVLFESNSSQIVAGQDRL